MLLFCHGNAKTQILINVWWTWESPVLRRIIPTWLCKRSMSIIINKALRSFKFSNWKIPLCNPTWRKTPWEKSPWINLQFWVDCWPCFFSRRRIWFGRRKMCKPPEPAKPDCPQDSGGKRQRNQQNMCAEFSLNQYSQLPCRQDGGLYCINFWL